MERGIKSPVQFSWRASWAIKSSRQRQLNLLNSAESNIFLFEMCIRVGRLKAFLVSGTRSNNRNANRFNVCGCQRKQYTGLLVSCRYIYICLTYIVTELQRRQLYRLLLKQRGYLVNTSTFLLLLLSVLF